MKEKKEKPAPREPETKVETTYDLATSIQGTVKSRWEDALGEEVDFDELTKNPDTLGEKIEKLLSNWSGTLDELCAVLAPFHMKSSDVRETIADLVPPPAAGEEQDPKEPPPPDWKGGELGWRNSKRAKHAVERLRDHPDWQAALEKASSRHGISVQTLIAFIEMESGWNPDSAPMWKNKNGKIIKGKFTREEARGKGLTLYSSAHGLAQAMGFNVPTYARKRYGDFRSENPHLNLPAEPNLYNPLIAIDFCAYHLREIIFDVNRIIDRQGARKRFSTDWKLHPNSNVKDLYRAYNNGPYGALVAQRYHRDREQAQTNPTEENLRRMEESTKELVWFQKRKKRDRDGKEILEVEAREAYASRVAQVASAIEYAPSSTRVA